MSFGYGLLLNDLNTSYSQPAFYRNGQAGLRVNYDGDYFTLEGMGTYSHLYGIQIKDISIFGSNIGFEYLSDSDRASSECFGRSAFGAFMDYPLTDQVKLFVETAGSSNGGEGDMAGVAFDYDLIMAFASIKMGSVSFNDRFIPGYFTAGYDIDPVDFVSLEADGKRRYGTLASVDIGILGAVALNLTNENYNDGGAATSGAILVTPLPYLSISGYVKELSFLDLREIQGKDANLIGASVEYDSRHGMKYSINYKKTPFGDDLKPIESCYCSIGCSF
jgi:hypothetical protein